MELILEIRGSPFPPAGFDGPSSGTIEQHIECCGDLAEKSTFLGNGGAPFVLDPAVIAQWDPFFIGNSQFFTGDEECLMKSRIAVIVDALISKRILDQFEILVIFRSQSGPKPTFAFFHLNQIFVMEIVKIPNWHFIFEKRRMIRTVFLKIANEFRKLRMEGRLAAHDPDTSFEILQRINGISECVIIHEKRFPVVSAEPCAVGTFVYTCVRDFNLNDFVSR